MQDITFPGRLIPARLQSWDFYQQILISESAILVLGWVFFFLIQADQDIFLAFIRLHSFLIRFPKEIKEGTMK